MQAAFSDRQRITDELGNFYGAIDAKALCNRLAAALQSSGIASIEPWFLSGVR